ncbi:MAG: hypothetical protein WBA13_03860 [Microcoleaceae cyanobacterium]
MANLPRTSLPLPPHYLASQVGRIWRVPYQQQVTEAIAWATQHHILPASQDQHRVGLLLMDVQKYLLYS